MTDTMKKEYRETAKAKWAGLSVSADIPPMLNEIADRLEAEFGFRPTISQTLRWLIKKEGRS